MIAEVLDQQAGEISQVVATRIDLGNEAQHGVGVLRDAVLSGQAIAVYEALQRSWMGVCVPLLSPIAVLLLSPFVPPFRWSRLLFTYLIPIAPLLISWDAVVSALRCYKPDELLAMAKGSGGEDYVWAAGSYWKRGVPVTYLVGYPRSRQQEEHLPRAPTAPRNAAR